MTYIAVCPACGDTVRSGAICGCGYLHLDANGHTYIRRHENEPWQRQPNILVRQEEVEPSLDSDDLAIEEEIEQPPSPKAYKKAEKD